MRRTYGKIFLILILQHSVVPLFQQVGCLFFYFLIAGCLEPVMYFASMPLLAGGSNKKAFSHYFIREKAIPGQLPGRDCLYDPPFLPCGYMYGCCIISSSQPVEQAFVFFY